MFAIGVFPEGGDVRSDFVHENLSLAWFCHVYHLLYHIVGVLILHHDVERRGGAVTAGTTDFLYQNRSLRSGRVLDTLLYNVTGKLVLGQV